jgi:hypothetical protein
MSLIGSDEEYFRAALGSYDNPFAVSAEEFALDLKRVTYLSKLLSRYALNKDDLKDRLILNHIVILGNCFTFKTAIQLIKYKCGSDADTFLYFMGLIESAESLDFKLLDYLEKTHGTRQTIS